MWKIKVTATSDLGSLNFELLAENDGINKLQRSFFSMGDYD